MLKNCNDCINYKKNKEIKDDVLANKMARLIHVFSGWDIGVSDSNRIATQIAELLRVDCNEYFEAFAECGEAIYKEYGWKVRVKEEK